jgi:hypothetical protein
VPIRSIRSGQFRRRAFQVVDSEGLPGRSSVTSEFGVLTASFSSCRFPVSHSRDVAYCPVLPPCQIGDLGLACVSRLRAYGAARKKGSSSEPHPRPRRPWSASSRRRGSGAAWHRGRGARRPRRCGAPPADREQVTRGDRVRVHDVRLSVLFARRRRRLRLYPLQHAPAGDCWMLDRDGEGSSASRWVAPRGAHSISIDVMRPPGRPRGPGGPTWSGDRPPAELLGARRRAMFGRRDNSGRRSCACAAAREPGGR